MHNMIEGVFNPQRLFLLLRRDFAHGYRAVLTAMAAVGGVLIVLSFLSMLGRAGQDFYTPFYVGLLFLGGFLFSSSAFKEMHQQGSGPFYLTLPGTTLEKLLSKLLVTSVGYAAAILVFMTGASALSELLNRAVFAAGHTWFNPFSPANLKSAAVYLVLQSLFLLGSVWFRKVVFLKILLAENIVVIGLCHSFRAYFPHCVLGLLLRQPPEAGGDPDVLPGIRKCRGERARRGSLQPGLPGIPHHRARALLGRVRARSAGWRRTSGSGKPRSRMEFQESQAIYLQIADMLCENVLSGAWKPGDRVPSIRELAESIAVNPNTVVRAYSYLQDHAIIHNQRGIGYFVAENAREITGTWRERDSSAASSRGSSGP